MNDPIAVLPSGFNAMTANIVVTMDDVVSAFVSKYENQLFERKKLLSKELAAATEAVRAHSVATRAKINAKKHNLENFSPFNLMAVAKDEVYLDFDKGRAQIEVVICHASDRSLRYTSSTINATVFEDLDPTDVEHHAQYEALAASLQAQLSDVLDKIKSVARKEREVRGRIALRKIEESGYSSLLDDGELLRLVQL